MNWRTTVKMIWTLMKEWQVIKDTLFQKFSAYHVPSSIPLPHDISSLSVIVTGATSGIGLHTAKALAMGGAHVIMACRNIEAANQIACTWQEEAGNKRTLKVEVMQLDLSSLSSVRKFSLDWEHRGEPLHVLINNAGILLTEEAQRFSADGIELHIHVNHVAPALLTLLLLPSLLRAPSSRIINVNSVGHYCGTVETQCWNSRIEDEKFNIIKVYGTSKLAHLMFLKTLAAQLSKGEKQSIRCIAVHPGAVATNLNTAAKKKLFFMFDAAEGARSVIFCATSDKVEDNLINGFTYYSSNCKPAKASPKAADMNECFEIWKKTMNILGLSTDYVHHVSENK